MFKNLTRKIALGTVVASAVAVGLTGATTQAAMTKGSSVVCNDAYNTITVTPHVTSNSADSDQYVATRVYVGTWTGAAWTWTVTPWRVDIAKASNNPMGMDISVLPAFTVNKSDGHHYVYTETYFHNGQAWGGLEGKYTTSYNIVTPSVSHEPNQTRVSGFCTL